MNTAGHRCCKGTVRNVLCAALCVALYANMPIAHAQSTASSESIRQYDIPAGSLSGALGAWGAQSDRQVVFTPDLVTGKQTKGASGQYGPEQALTQLLAGTGLAWKRVNGQTYALEKAPPPQPVNANQKPASKAKASSSAAPQKVTQLDTVSVTGTRLTSAESGEAQEKIVLDRQTIDASGATTVAELLNMLPQFSLQSTAFPAQNGRGASFSNLRGLPSDFTLTLINGRRVGYGADEGQGAFNLSILPLAAIDRIEVLPAGSAAVYGGSALAGIVNVILKDHLDGGEVDFNRGGADGYEDSGADVAWGKNWGRFSLFVGGTYRGNTALRAYQRSITADKNYSRFGGPDVKTPYTDPGNVYSLNGQPLPGLTSTFAGIPQGQNGAHLTTTDFKATDGIPNANSQLYEIMALIPKSEQYSGFLNASFRVNDYLELFSEWLYTHTKGEESDYPKFAIGQFGAVVVPANNPYNPFGVPIGINYLFRGTTSCYCLTTDYTRGLIGARGDFGDTSWNWEITALETRNNEKESITGTIDNAKLNAALAQTDPALALNLFGDRLWTDQGLAPYVTNISYPFRTTLQYVNGFVRGQLFDLGAGPWEAVLGMEYEHDAMNYGPYYGTFFNGTYSNKAAFAELSVPLIASRSGNNSAGATLALTGAMRYDDYSSFGGRVSPEIGAQFRPIPTLLLRANYSSAYKPPTLYQLDAPLSWFQGPLTDPRRGDEVYAMTVYTGGNPKLDALTGNVKTYGFIYSPSNAYGLEFSVTGFKIHTDNYPHLLDQQILINFENLFPGTVIRAEPSAADAAKGYAGRITSVIDTYQNFGTFDVAGADLDLSWYIKTDRYGDFKPSFAATYMYEYKYQFSPVTAPVETISQANSTGYAPRWKGVASLAWKRGPVQATVMGRWVGAYRDYDDYNPATPVRKLGNFWMFDANLRFDIGKIVAADSSWLAKTYVIVGGVNIFNRLPSYSYYTGTAPGYDPTQYDIRGRYLYVNCGLKF